MPWNIGVNSVKNWLNQLSRKEGEVYEFAAYPMKTMLFTRSLIHETQWGKILMRKHIFWSKFFCFYWIRKLKSNCNSNEHSGFLKVHLLQHINIDVYLLWQLLQTRLGSFYMDRIKEKKLKLSIYNLVKWK